MVPDPSVKIVTALQPDVTPELNNYDKTEILLVEDNVELRTHLAAELRAEYTVFESSNGIDGVAIALEKIPDLIISDILMASQNGLELCKTLKSDVKTSHIPIILLTAKASVDEQIIGIEAGADIYITKPFNYRYLLTHIRNIVASRRKLYALFSKDVYLLPAKAATNEIDQAFLQRIIDHIVAHIQDAQLSVDSVAEVFNLSRVQVYRKIKALTGKSAVELIRSVRLKQALKLMETKKYTLAEIAYQTGFNSPSYFTRSFKEEYGKAPSAFLEEN
jgi:DNA-binding response OmpR family regulator